MSLVAEMVCIPGKESPMFFSRVYFSKKIEDDNDSGDEMGGTVVGGDKEAGLCHCS